MFGAAALGAVGAVGLPFADRPATPAPPIPVAMRCPEQPVGLETKLTVRLDSRRLIGLRVPEAKRHADRHGCFVRIYHLNGKPYETFLDERYYRINLNVEHGVVAGIEGVF